LPTVKTLDRKREDYLGEERKLYEALYRGGHRLEKLVDKILPKRPMESASFWEARKALFHYLPRAAQIIDHLTGMVFQGDLEILAKAEGDKERPTLPDFYNEFFEDPLGGNPKTKIVDVWFSGLNRAQIHANHFVRVVFPDTDLGETASRGDQESAGALRAKLRMIDADSVFDYEEDPAGLVWIKIATKIEDRDPLVEDKDRTCLYRWQVIDRKTIKTYELSVEYGKEPKPDEEVPLKDEVEHRWAKADRVPVVRLGLGDDVWLMDRIASMGVAETRKRNGLNWLEEVCCYPQPVHKGDESIKERQEADPSQNTKRGALYLFEIGPDEELEYLEPGGTSLDHIAKRLEAMGHEMATVVHQAASAQGPEAAKQIESAASKVRDSVAERIIAGCYADEVRKAAAETCDLVAIGRGEAFRFEALGLEQHDIADVAEAAAEAVTVQGVNVPSKTFRTRYMKRFIRRVLPGEPDKEYETMDKEIDAAAPEDIDPAAESARLDNEAKKIANENPPEAA
jgi:hypothetical protein